jgi:hypothetical protein
MNKEQLTYWFEAKRKMEIVLAGYLRNERGLAPNAVLEDKKDSMGFFGLSGAISAIWSEAMEGVITKKL